MLEGLRQLNGVRDIDTLRLILEKQHGRAVSNEEALEVGESLICYFTVLASEKSDDEDSLGEVI